MPPFLKTCPVPHSLNTKVIKELQYLQDLWVITPVEHSDWAAPIVPIVKADWSIRLCRDYKVTVNPALISDTYPLPRVADLFTALSGDNIFTKLDLSQAYLQGPRNHSILYSTQQFIEWERFWKEFAFNKFFPCHQVPQSL